MMEVCKLNMEADVAEIAFDIRYLSLKFVCGYSCLAAKHLLRTLAIHVQGFVLFCFFIKNEQISFGGKLISIPLLVCLVY